MKHRYDLRLEPLDGLRRPMMRIKINVTKEHIQRGYQASTSSCPVALAISEQLKATQVCVTRDGCAFRDADGSLWFGDLSKEGQRFVRKFDKTKRVRAASFYLLELFAAERMAARDLTGYLRMEGS